MSRSAGRRLHSTGTTARRIQADPPMNIKGDRSCRRRSLLHTERVLKMEMAPIRGSKLGDVPESTNPTIPPPILPPRPSIFFFDHHKHCSPCSFYSSLNPIRISHHTSCLSVAQ